MVNASLVLAASLVGVQYGYQPAEGGGLEYVIHIEPELIASLGEQGITSEIPPNLEGVRRYRIAVTRATPPRIPLPTPKQEPESAAAPQNSAPPTPDEQAEPANDNQPQPVVNADSPAAEKPEPPEPGSRFPLIPPATQKSTQGNSPRLDLPPPPSDEPQDESPPQDDSATAGDRYPTMPDRYPEQSPTPDKTPPQNDSSTDSTTTDSKTDGAPPPILQADPASVEIPNPQKTFRPAGESAAEQAATQPAATPEPDRPWIPFVVALLALAGSVGANIYMVWTWLGTRRRYRELVHVRASS